MKRSIIILFCFLLNTVPLISSITIGLRSCLNQWNKASGLTVAPELSYTWRWLCLSADVTYGQYTIEGEETDHFRIRSSLVPLFKVTPVRPLCLSAGYGIAFLSGHSENDPLNSSSRDEAFNHLKGEFRSTIGFELSISANTLMTAKAGYNYISKDWHYLSFSLGLTFQNDQQKVNLPLSANRVAVKPLTQENETEGNNHRTLAPVDEIRSSSIYSASQQSEDSGPDRIQKIAVAKVNDIIQHEFNMAIETALVEDGFDVISWEILRKKVQDHTSLEELHRLQPGQNPGINNYATGYDNILIAMAAVDYMDLDAIFETTLRYQYKNYGGEILTDSAIIKLINAKTGKLLWAYTFDESSSPFHLCKEKIIKAALKTLKKLNE